MFDTLVVIPAQAGIQAWIPACAGEERILEAPQDLEHFVLMKGERCTVPVGNDGKIKKPLQHSLSGFEKRG